MNKKEYYGGIEMTSIGDTDASPFGGENLNGGSGNPGCVGGNCKQVATIFCFNIIKCNGNKTQGE